MTSGTAASSCSTAAAAGAAASAIAAWPSALGMHRAAIDRGQNSPGRVVDIGRLLRRRQALRIGHGREVAVIGVADPARARQIGAIFAGAAAAQHRLAGGGDDIGIEAVAAWPKSIAGRIPDRFARARKNRGLAKRGLMGVDEGHAVGARIAAQDAATGTARALSAAAGIRSDKTRHVGEPLRRGVEGGMDIEAGAAAGAGRAAVRQRRVGVGHIDHAREVARPAASAPRAVWQSPAAGRAPTPRANRRPIRSRRCAGTARVRSACPRSRRRPVRKN